jgi:LysR family transcriptional activator for leuABCD operon
MNIRSIDLNLLGVFTVLMNEQNLTHAADNLGMTQSAVSHALKRLRTLYNDPLFERKKGKMQPTHRAIEIFPLISQVLEDVKSTLPNKAAAKPSELSLEYRININNIDNSIFLHPLIKHFLEHAPGITLTVTTDTLQDPEFSLRNREYDLHIDLVKIAESGCHNEDLLTEIIYVVASKEHPRLKDLISITQEQYLAEKHAILVPRKGSDFALRQFIHSLSLDRDVRYKSENVRDLLEIVRTTDLLCVAPKSIINAHPNKSDYIKFEFPFENFAGTAFMNWYWGVEHYPAHKYIRNMIKKICNNIDQS